MVDPTLDHSLISKPSTSQGTQATSSSFKAPSAEEKDIPSSNLEDAFSVSNDTASLVSH